MSTPKETVWEMDPHTYAKHEILREYLKAWFPILSTWSGRIVYLDGFAGPGVYSKNEDGSPVVAIKTAVEHVMVKRFREIVFWFIENDPRRADNLTKVLKEKFSQLPGNLRYEVETSEFAPSLDVTLDHIENEGGKLAPTFAFLDPFGFSGLPMELVSRILGYQSCEVLITFMSSFVNRFNDPLRENALDELYGTSEWRGVRDIVEPDERRKFLINLYVSQLREKADAPFVRTFEMIGRNNQLIYHLVFATKHRRGLEVMKEAMLKVDRRGTYRFSDRTDPNQSYILDYSEENTWIPQAADAVYKKFKGLQATVDTIQEFVIDNTPFVFRKGILIYLEKSNPSKITEVTGRRRVCTYPNGECVVKFR